MQHKTIRQITSETTEIEFLTRLNIMLSTNYNNHQEDINAILELIGKYTRHDRIHIIEVRHDMKISTLYEWNNKELASQHQEIKSQKILLDKTLESQLYSQDFIMIDESDETINPEIKILLNTQHAQKIILYPLYESGAQFAFIAFIQCLQKHNWSKDEVRLMAGIASIIATNLNKKLLTDKLKYHLHHQKEYKQQLALLGTYLDSLQPTWQQLKDLLKTAGGDELQPQLDLFERHFHSVNKICRNMAIK